MSASKMTSQNAVGALALAVLIGRCRDIRHLPRLVLEEGSAREVSRITLSSLAIYSYEKLVAALLRRLGLARFPSTLAAMLSLFAALVTTKKFAGREASERLMKLLRPGVDFLGKWMGLCLAPPLVSLDKSVAKLPLHTYGQGVWVNTAGVLTLGWAATHSVAAHVATRLAPRRGPTAAKRSGSASVPPATAVPAATSNVSQDEAVRRAWVFLGAVSYVAVSLSDYLPEGLRRPVGMACELSTTVGSFTLAKLLPATAQRVMNPLVICAVSSNLASRHVAASGCAALFFGDEGRGVGDQLFRWLPAAVTGLGARMYSSTGLWFDDAEDFRCVLATCGASGCFSLLFTALLAVAQRSPLGVPAKLSLPLLHRSVMSALGIEGSKAVGAEGDPTLAVASILITGCIGTSLGGALVESCPALFDASSPLVRGVAMGCSAHSIGTAGLISNGDTEAAAISGASMCLAGAMHTLVLQVPGIVPTIRSLAGLPSLG